MSNKYFLAMSLPALALAAWLLSPGLAVAQHGGHGGGHGGGGHASAGFHGGGFHGGNFHGGSFHSGSFHNGSFHSGSFHGNGFHAGSIHAGGFHGKGFRGEFHGRNFGFGFWPWYGLGLGFGYYPWYYDYPWSTGYYGAYAPWYGNYYGYTPDYGDYYGAYEPYYGSAPAGTYTPQTQGGTYGYFEVPPSGAGAATAPPDDNMAYVNVRVPPDAHVWFEGVLTNEMGTSRMFESPPLTPGRVYSYEIRAQWNEDNHLVTQTRHIDIRAGDRVTVDFALPPTANRMAPATSSPPPLPSGTNEKAPTATSTPSAKAPAGGVTPPSPPPPPRPQGS